MEHRRPQDIPAYHASGAERLERLADFLDGLCADALTFCFWYFRGQGCAIGLAAAMDPWFKAQGLRLESTESMKDCRPVYRNHSDWQAVVAFFGISGEEARALFDRRGYDGQVRPHPRRVAQKIRAHLRAAALDGIAA